MLFIDLRFGQLVNYNGLSQVISSVLSSSKNTFYYEGIHDDVTVNHTGCPIYGVTSS